MYMYKSGVILPYSVLTAEYLDFLSNDPGYPFARVAPPLINIASGLWEREFTRGGWSQSMGGDAHWQTIAFQFALVDAQLCKNQVGKTVTYKHTITQQDEYAVDVIKRKLPACGATRLPWWQKRWACHCRPAQDTLSSKIYSEEQRRLLVEIDLQYLDQSCHWGLR